EAAILLGNLLGGELAAQARDRILAAAEGNPLFVEESLGMLVDDGLVERRDGRWVQTGDLSDVAIPPTVQTLLAARLDRCPESERALLGRASIVGKVFYRQAVEALSPEGEREGVRGSLTALVRRGLIRPDPGDIPGAEAFRFHHILFRDAAYRALAKEVLAELHERLAAWLDGRLGEAEE